VLALVSLVVFCLDKPRKSFLGIANATELSRQQNCCGRKESGYTGFDAALLFRLPNIVDTEAECLLHLCQPRTNEDTIATRKIIDGKLREKL